MAKGQRPSRTKGAGMIDHSIQRLVIHFTGDDWDGFHDDGEMIFRDDN